MDYLNLRKHFENECLDAASESLKWIFYFLPFMIYGFIKASQLLVSFVNNLLPVEIFSN